MKQILKLGGLMLVVALLFAACADDPNELQELDVRGATVTISGNAPGFFDLTNPNTTANSFTVDFGKGENISAITVFKSYEGGEEVEAVSLNSIPGTVNVSLTETLQGLGVSVDDLAVGDVFTFTFDITTPSGVYRAGRSVDVPMSCPSSLAGTYDAVSNGTSTDPCCPDATTVNSVVTITETGGGKYDISDWSGGLYFEWYEVYGMAADGTPGAITDICNDITYDTDAEPFGESLTGTGIVDGTTITLTWSNGWGDQGTVVLTPQ